jgi:hypothetical protein
MNGEIAIKHNTLERLHTSKNLLNAIFCLSFSLVFYRLMRDFSLGGHRWRQGDWLINNHGEIIRRGPLGSFFIYIGDLAATDPLVVVIAVQLLISIALYISFRHLIVRHAPPSSWVLLAISPALFLLLWPTEAITAFRKEMIVFVALCLFALGAIRRNWFVYWAAVATYVIAMISHEAMILFLPVFVAVMWATDLLTEKTGICVATSTFLAAVAAGSLAYAVAFSQTNDVRAICVPLLERGLTPNICSGAIWWLSFDTSYGFNGDPDLLSFARMLGFFLGYLSSLLPVFYLGWLYQRMALVLTLTVVLFVPFAPLYFVAIDWGRWVSMHVFSLIIVLICLQATGRLKLVALPSKKALFRITCVSLLIAPMIAPSYGTGFSSGGIIFSTLKEAVLTVKPPD